MSIGLTACADEITDAKDDARAGLHTVWIRTAERLNSIPLSHGTPSTRKLLENGVPPISPAPGTRGTVLGSSELALTTRLLRSDYGFTVDLFLRADGSAGSGDLLKQWSAYDCVRVTVMRGSTHLFPHPLPCRSDLLNSRNRETTERVHLQDLTSSDPQTTDLGTAP